jgi:homoserine O-acetyltransferase
MRFPIVTVADMVRAQRRLLDHLGIESLQAVIGGCLGGMQAMEWGRLYPDDVDRLVVIGATAATSAHTLGLWHTVRRCITDDPNWNGGDYYDGSPPRKGLGLAMMMAMLLWMGRDGFAHRFGRRLTGDEISYGFEADFEAERFLDGVAESAGAKFDPNSLLYLTRAMDYFDLTGGKVTLEQALSPVRASTLLVSYRSDWRYPPEEMEPIRGALAANGVSARHCILDSSFGHGAFLHDPGGLVPLVRGFLAPSLIAALTS